MGNLLSRWKEPYCYLASRDASEVTNSIIIRVLLYDIYQLVVNWVVCDFQPRRYLPKIYQGMRWFGPPLFITRLTYWEEGLFGDTRRIDGEILYCAATFGVPSMPCFQYYSIAMHLQPTVRPSISWSSSFFAPGEQGFWGTRLCRTWSFRLDFFIAVAGVVKESILIDISSMGDKSRVVKQYDCMQSLKGHTHKFSEGMTRKRPKLYSPLYTIIDQPVPPHFKVAHIMVLKCLFSKGFMQDP